MNASLRLARTTSLLTALFSLTALPAWADGDLESKASEEAVEALQPRGPQTHVRSGRVMALGISLAGVGAIVGGYGAAFLVVKDRCRPLCEAPTVPAGMLAFGIVVVALGIPLILHGAERVPDRQPAIAPQVSIGPGSFHAAWTF